MDVAKHWHGYSWIGNGRPADTERKPENAQPPLEIAHWLMKSKSRVAVTFPNNEEGQEKALEWMRKCAAEHVYLSEESFPLEERLAYTADDLSRGADVVWGYYSKGQAYVSRALIACPRPETAPTFARVCPYGVK
ncbi:hypothetical protein ACGFLS_30605 [Streptomyces abikoensis]|uniref:hypothetical protein n=1 Tax=Streptomyces abikoensis TaxID=97398 RepID=UPI0037117502